MRFPRLFLLAVPAAAALAACNGDDVTTETRPPLAGVRYINASGKMSFFEGAAHPVANEARALIAASQNVVNAIGPWDKARLPPPAHGRVRMSFIVSDGLYFGEGQFADLERDRLAGGVINAATQLVAAIANLTTSLTASN